MSRYEIGEYGNGMRQGRYNPTMVEGEVVVSCFPDPMLMYQKVDNDKHNRQGVYPGGSNPNNNVISRGELVLSLRERQNGSEYATELPQIYGVSSANGLDWADYGSHDALERDYCFVGFAKTNYRTGDPDQPEHGFPAYAAGKITIDSLNSGEDGYAGDEMEWGMPPNPNTPGFKGSRIPTIVPGRRAGALGKNTFIVKRVDYTDYSVCLAGFYARLGASRQAVKSAGVQGISFADVFRIHGARDNVAKLSNAQEQDAKLKFGKGTQVLSAIEFLVKEGYLQAGPTLRNVQQGTTNAATAKNVAVALADAIGLYSDDRIQVNPLMMRMFASMMWPELIPDMHTNEARRDYTNQYGDPGQMKNEDARTTAEIYARAKLQSASLEAQGYTLMSHHKRSKRIGRLLMGTPAYESADLLVRR